MGRPPPPEPTTRKSVALPNSMWDEINEVRRAFEGRIPSEAEAVRLLLKEALDARAKKARRTKA